MPAPPPDLTPASAALVYDGRSSRRALTTAMLDLANRGEIAFDVADPGTADGAGDRDRRAGGPTIRRSRRPVPGRLRQPLTDAENVRAGRCSRALPVTAGRIEHADAAPSSASTRPVRLQARGSRRRPGLVRRGAGKVTGRYADAGRSSSGPAIVAFIVGSVDPDRRAWPSWQWASPPAGVRHRSRSPGRCPPGRRTAR